MKHFHRLKSLLKKDFREQRLKDSVRYGIPAHFPILDDLIEHPVHPYTVGLIEAIPENYDSDRHFRSIPGSQPGANAKTIGCAFAPRCDCATGECRAACPELKEVLPGHTVRCFNIDGKRIKV